MDVRPGDKLMMKKQHPCGSKEFLVLRAGMDFKIRCMGCGHEIMVPRLKCEKNIKKSCGKQQSQSSSAEAVFWDFNKNEKFGVQLCLII